MEVKTFDIPGLALVTPRAFDDDRGYFFESWNDATYASLGLLDPTERFVQDNESGSKRGVVRGLHFQRAPFAQAKLVRVVRGRGMDVAVDIRVGSPTFGQYQAVSLSGENRHQFFVPAGFAHGFISLEEGTIFVYKVTAPYAKECDGGIRFDDPTLNIPWPTHDQLIVSEKDRILPTLSEYLEQPAFRYGEC